MNLEMEDFRMRFFYENNLQSYVDRLEKIKGRKKHLKEKESLIFLIISTKNIIKVMEKTEPKEPEKRTQILARERW